MASINRQTRSNFQFCMRNANNSQSLGVHTHFCGRCRDLPCRCTENAERPFELGDLLAVNT